MVCWSLLIALAVAGVVRAGDWPVPDCSFYAYWGETVYFEGGDVMDRGKWDEYQSIANQKSRVAFEDGSYQIYSNGAVSILSPFFDRENCLIIAFSEDVECAFDPTDYSTSPPTPLYKGVVPCPRIPDTKCDQWYFFDQGVQSTMNFYFKQNTNVPVQYNIVHIETGNTNNITYDFWKWTSGEPDDSVFHVPATQYCSNFTWVNSKKANTKPLLSINARTHKAEPTVHANKLINQDEERLKMAAAGASTWTAAKNPHFDGVTFADVVKSLKPLNTPRHEISHAVAHKASFVGDIPAQFDARTQWPKCASIGAIRDQASCGSCWAFAASESFADRFCIASNASIAQTFSPQWMVSCFTTQAGCSGGNLDTAWMEMVQKGLVTEECYPYLGEDAECPTKCADGSAFKTFKPKSAYTTPYTGGQLAANAKAIQAEIMANGPVEIGFWVWSDFMYYSSGIYHLTAGAQLEGGHAVKLVGWGTENGVDYWMVANSWGTSWGENGYFRIRRGVDECSVEDEVATGLPVF